MDLQLRDKIVLITGGSKGIGLACARGFLAEGAVLAIASRSEANLANARRILGTTLTIAADLIDERAAAGVVDAVERELGPIDVLVNSAGAARRTPPGDLTPQAWRAGMNAKYFTYINVIDPVVKRMAARGKGVIVNIIGSGGKVAGATHLAGGAANAALMLATVASPTRMPPRDSRRRHQSRPDAHRPRRGRVEGGGAVARRDRSRRFEADDRSRRARTPGRT